MAWIGLALSIAWNYAAHRRHKPTICSVSRRLPKHLLLPVYAAGAVSLGVHVYRGYKVVMPESVGGSA